MQSAVPDVVDLSRESAGTRGAVWPRPARHADLRHRCLLSRRLIEQGVRFVGVYLKGQPWDHARRQRECHEEGGRRDRPTLGGPGLADLKARGLLDSTLVVWMGEFGRTPVSQGANGRGTTAAAASRSGSPAAAFAAAIPTARPTNLATSRSSRSSPCTTCTPRCSPPWGSTTIA